MALDKPERSSIQIIAHATQINSYLASPPVIPSSQIFDYQNALSRELDSVGRRIARLDLNQIVWLERFHQSLQDCFGWRCLEIFFTISTRDLPEERNDEIEHASPEGRVHLEYSQQAGVVFRLNSKSKAQRAHPDSSTLHRGFPEQQPFILPDKWLPTTAAYISLANGNQSLQVFGSFLWRCFGIGFDRPNSVQPLALPVNEFRR